MINPQEAREILHEREGMMGIVERDGELALASDSPYATVQEAQAAAYEAAKTIWEQSPVGNRAGNG